MTTTVKPDPLSSDQLPSHPLSSPTQSILPRRSSAWTAAGASLKASLAPADQFILQGWVMKKKRKVMQGYAMRYLTLGQDGTLSYSMGPGQPVRDEIEVPHARVLSSHCDLGIHVDSGETTFHLRMRSQEDFELWRKALRDVISTQPTNRTPDQPTHLVYTARSGSQDLVGTDLGPIIQGAERVRGQVTEAQLAIARLVCQSSKSKQAKRLEELVTQLAGESSAMAAYLHANVPSQESTLETLVRSEGTTQGKDGHDRTTAGSFADVSSFAQAFEEVPRDRSLYSIPSGSDISK